MSQIDFKGWALYYARLGWYVFPLQSGDKVPPAGFKWTEESTTDPAKVEHLWTLYPAANIGVHLGKSDLAAVDIDPRHQGDTSFAVLQVEHGLALSPLRSASGRGDGGTHQFFKAPAGVRIRAALPGVEGVDIKRGNGYVVLPPSVHPEPKAPATPWYRWLSEPPTGEGLPELPACFIEPERKARATVEHAGPATGAELEFVRRLLAFFDPDCSEPEWYGILASVKAWGDEHDCEPEARELAINWSAEAQQPDKFNPYTAGM